MPSIDRRKLAVRVGFVLLALAAGLIIAVLLIHALSGKPAPKSTAPARSFAIGRVQEPSTEEAPPRGELFPALRAEQIREPWVREMSLLHICEFALHREKCPVEATPTREQLNSFFPFSLFPVHRVGIPGDCYWMRPFSRRLVSTSPAAIIEDELARGTSHFLKLLDVSFSTLSLYVGNDLPRQLCPFRHPLTHFYDPALLRAFREDFFGPDSDVDALDSILKQLGIVVAYRLWLAGVNSPLPEQHFLSQISTEEWRLFISDHPHTVGALLEFFCSINFPLDDEDEFDVAFRQAIKLPRFSPLITYMRWLAAMRHGERLARLVEQHKLMSRSRAEGLKVCHRMIFDEAAPIGDVLQCVDSVTPAAYHEEMFLARAMLYSMPGWPSLPMTGFNSGQKLEALFIAEAVALEELDDPSAAWIVVEKREVGIFNFHPRMPFTPMESSNSLFLPHQQSEPLTSEKRLEYFHPRLCNKWIFLFGLLRSQFNELSAISGTQWDELEGALCQYATAGLPTFQVGTLNTLRSILNADAYRTYVVDRLSTTSFQDNPDTSIISNSYFATKEGRIGLAYAADLCRYRQVMHKLWPSIRHHNFRFPDAFWLTSAASPAMPAILAHAGLTFYSTLSEGSVGALAYFVSMSFEDNTAPSLDEFYAECERRFDAAVDIASLLLDSLSRQQDSY